LNLALRYDTLTRFGDLTTEVSARYVSKEYDQPSDDPTLIVGAYGYADAFVGFTPKNAEHWNFKVWSKNIADRHYVATFYNGAGLGWNGLGYADPRTFGLTASYRIK
jgi:outer membrane receptor protein involved in Fe transport